MAERFLSLREVLHRTSLSRSQVYRLLGFGTFPKSVPISAGRVAFLESEIDAWIDARILERAA